MTSRRAARAAQTTTEASSDRVIEAFSDITHDAWATIESAQAFASNAGIDVTVATRGDWRLAGSQGLICPHAERLRTVARAWAEQHHMANNYKALHDLGIITRSFHPNHCRRCTPS